MKKNSVKKIFRDWKNDLEKFVESYGEAMMKI